MAHPRIFPKHALVTVVLAFAVATQLDTPVSAGHRNGSLHWSKPSSGQRTMELRRFYVQYNDALTAAATTWGQHTEFTLKLLTAGSSTCSMPGSYGQVKACDANYGDYWACGGWTGRFAGCTEWILSGSHFQRGRVRLHTGYASDHRQSGWCHELGHMLGLRHRSSGNTCMRGVLGNRYPDQHDYGEVNGITHTHAGRIGGDDGRNGECALRRPEVCVGPGQIYMAMAWTADGEVVDTAWIRVPNAYRTHGAAP